MNLQFREATPRDVEAVALLHAESWRTTYRGMLTDTFLEQDVVSNRLSVWQQRFHTPAENQLVLLAEKSEELHGFICLFGGADEILGSFVENLHVSPKMQGQGIGRKLLVQAGRWVRTHFPHPALYLWVYEANHAARRFYERLGATVRSRGFEDAPDGSKVPELCYIWENVEVLLRTNPKSDCES